MKKLLLLIAVALLTSIATMAQPRSEQQAIQIAQDFFAKSTKKKAPKLSVVPQQKVTQQIRKKVASAQKTPTQHSSHYVINDVVNDRFVIVSADERMYTILGYSDNGTFDADSIPEGLMDILYGYDQQYDYLLQNAKSSTNYNVKRQVAKAVDPLIKTQWGQESPYNDNCPMETVLGIVDMRTVTGCVATAMAQIMNYHRYPAQGKGYTSYTTSSNIRQSMNFSSVNFDWSNMNLVYDEASTDIQKKAVAELMHACGVSVHMDYSWIESGAFAEDIAYALINYFKYNPNIKYYERRYFSKADWDKIIQEDLANGRPILYSGMGEGKNSDGTTYKYGHQFVLDGCTTEGKYHFNFGWKGKYDGYFELTSINPDEDSDFNLDQAMVCNVSPEVSGKHEDIFFATAVLYNKKKINVGSSTSVVFDPHCAVVESNSYGEKFNGVFGIGVFDMNKNFVKSLYQRTENRMSVGTFYEELTAYLTFDRSTFTEGSTYYIAPYAKSNSSSEYTWMRTTYGLWDFEIATTKDGVVTLGDIPEPPTGKVFASAFNANNAKVSWKMTLTKDNTANNVYWFDGIDPAIKNGSNKVKAELDPSGILKIPVGQEVGEGLTITNYSSPNEILVTVSREDSTMAISGTWGTLKTSESEDKVNQEYFSQYSLTQMTFKYVPVEKPLIIFDENDTIVNIICATEDAHIYYTKDGTTPSSSSSKEFEKPFKLDGNCTVKAIAVKGKDVSDMAELNVKFFKVLDPQIIVTKNEPYTVTVSTQTPNAQIYYTLDGSSPAEKSTRKEYTGPFNLSDYCTISAIAERANYNSSEVVVKGPVGPIPGDVIFVDNNVAGKLVERMTLAEKMNCKKLIISGQLNGSDIALIREMLLNNKLMSLDIQDANIVSGGEPYYKTNYSQENTEDNVIGENMFYNCKNLAELKLPVTATTIEMFAISGCELLQELTIACATVKGSAIRNCKNLEIVTLATTVNNFDGGNFDGCPKLENIAVESTNSSYTSEDGILYDKNKITILKYPMGRTAKAYNILASVKTIGKDAFSYAKFEQISIPESVVTIESSAFEYCRNLTAVKIPNSVTKISSMAFWSCTQLSSVEMSSALSKLEMSVFYGCVNLREFSISKGIREIASSAFENCTSLQKFNVDEGNRWFASENGVLYSYNMVTLVRCPLAYYAELFRVPDGVLTIADNAFSKCVNIGKIVLPNSVTEIGNSAFEDTNITAIDMPSTVNTIGSMAFWGCKKLENFIVPENMDVIPMSMMYNCSGLKYLEIPSGIREIKSSAFSGCKSLKTIKCDISVKDISKVKVEQSYDGTYDQFKGVPADCTWIVPAEGDENNIEEYRKQPWFVSTWNLIDPVKEIRLSSSDAYNTPWYTLQGARLNHKPIQSGIYIHGGRKIIIK